MLGEILESYCSFMKYLKLNPGIVSDEKQLSSSVVKLAQDLNQQGQLNYPESISLQNFSNGILSCENKGYFSVESSEKQKQLRVMPWNLEKENTLLEIQEFLLTLAEKPSAIVGF
jgi:glycerol-3-phosphate O-acyltransferase